MGEAHEAKSWAPWPLFGLSSCSMVDGLGLSPIRGHAPPRLSQQTSFFARAHTHEGTSK